MGMLDLLPPHLQIRYPKNCPTVGLDGKTFLTLSKPTMERNKSSKTSMGVLKRVQSTQSYNYLSLGALLALMGPSGCGKTTLLNILSRRLKSSSVTGTQLLAGSTFDDATLRAISTYVEQEDHLIGSLTVRETIEFAAKLALPGNVSARERGQRTEDMLRDFGLVGIKDSKIGTPLQRGISGGQKRRVTTASQLITLPRIIFLGSFQFTERLTSR